MFQMRHHNRLVFPTKHVLICEDDIEEQIPVFNNVTSGYEPEVTLDSLWYQEERQRLLSS